MITKSQIKLIQSLRSSHDREKERLFVVEGVKMIEELLKSKFQIEFLFATVDWIPPSYITKMNYEIIHDWELERISSLTTPNKVLGVASLPEEPALDNLDQELVIMLDQISDPGNMGTIIRTAEWFGINRVIATKNSVDFWNHKVVQASMGSVFRMKLNRIDSPQFFKYTGNMPVYGTFLDGADISTIKLTPSGVIIIGNESNGISPVTEAYVTKRITIPAAANSSSESLNASIAAAVVCYEFHKQFHGY